MNTSETTVQTQHQPLMTPTFSVIICGYTLQRWQFLKEAVASAKAQELAPAEIIVCVDHNAELAARCRQEWDDDALVRVIENRYPGRLGSARNSAVELATAEVLAFLDDDASAPPGWLAQFAAIYGSDAGVQAVGGAPQPRFETSRPRWFPYEFDWVFGCAYRGLPNARGAAARLIGANMSARREAVLEVGGFHSDNHDDMDLSHRLLARYGDGSIVFDPEIPISHFVGAERVRWSYFWRRCFNVNRGKVLAVRDMEHAGNHDADLEFVRNTLLRVIPRYLLSPADGGFGRAAATVAGVLLAALGNLCGRVELITGRTGPSLTRGLQPLTEETR